jgi:two-component system cell cycle response regulator CpdR
MDVLLIEDDAAIRELLAEMLGEAGLRVVELPDGKCLFGPEPGMEAAPPGVVVTDVDLGAGRRSGIEDAARARRLWPEVGVVFITGRPSNLHGHALGQHDRFLPKPFPSASLVQAVASLLPA